MPTVICPKCKQSYNIDAASVGKECECPCGYSFIAEVKPATSIVIPAKPKPVSAPPQKPKRPGRVTSGTASALRILGSLGIIGGFIIIFAGLAESDDIVLFIGGGVIGSSLFYLAVSVIIETLLQIQENTRLLVERYNDEAG